MHVAQTGMRHDDQALGECKGHFAAQTEHQEFGVNVTLDGVGVALHVLIVLLGFTLCRGVASMCDQGGVTDAISPVEVAAEDFGVRIGLREVALTLEIALRVAEGCPNRKVVRIDQIRAEDEAASLGLKTALHRTIAFELVGLGILACGLDPERIALGLSTVGGTIFHCAHRIGDLIERVSVHAGCSGKLNGGVPNLRGLRHVKRTRGSLAHVVLVEHTFDEHDIDLAGVRIAQSNVRVVIDETVDDGRHAEVLRQSLNRRIGRRGTASGTTGRTASGTARRAASRTTSGPAFATTSTAASRAAGRTTTSFTTSRIGTNGEHELAFGLAHGHRHVVIRLVDEVGAVPSRI